MRTASWLAAGFALVWVSVAAAEDRALDCLIEPKERLVVSAPVIGTVTEVLVERGDFVEAGQPLARLESSMEAVAVVLAERRATARAQIEQSKARFEFETRRLERGEQLHERGVLSIHELDEVDSARLVAKADQRAAAESQEIAAIELERARTALALRTVYSPISGVVVRRIRGPGEFADPPELIEVAQIDPLHVEVFAPASWLGQISPSMTGQVQPEQSEDASYEATVSVVDPIVDPKSGTFGVRLQLPNPDLEITAGLRCRVIFDD